jgi:hypothetical protein
MQVIVLAVQNAVEYRDMGTATSANTFFRSLGGAFGTAIFGAILTGSVRSNVNHLLPGLAGKLEGGVLQGTPEAIHSLPKPVLDKVLESYVSAYHLIFLVAVPFAVAAFVLALILPELPLRGSPTTVSSADETGAIPEMPPEQVLDPATAFLEDTLEAGANGHLGADANGHADGEPNGHRDGRGARPDGEPLERCAER